MLVASRVAMSKEPNGKWRLSQANRNASLWSGEEAWSGEEVKRVDDIGGLSTDRIGAGHGRQAEPIVRAFACREVCRQLQQTMF
jgi:hypothetical protein